MQSAHRVKAYDTKQEADTGRKTHDNIVGEGDVVVLGDALVDTMWCTSEGTKSGPLNALTVGYAKHGQGHDAFGLLSCVGEWSGRRVC